MESCGVRARCAAYGARILFGYGYQSEGAVRRVSPLPGGAHIGCVAAWLQV
jgi:hypothetical protein